MEPGFTTVSQETTTAPCLGKR